jgi:diguanylate cyclase (GGDEF)-like protein
VTRAQLSRVVDWGIVVAGVVVAIVTFVQLGADPGMVDARYFLGIPLIAVMGSFPLLVGRTGGGIEIGLDAWVLVFLASLTGPWQSLAVWSLGCAACQLLNDKRPATKAFNTGLGIVCGALALTMIQVLRGAERGTPRELYAIAVGAAAYFLADFILSGLSLSLEEDTRVADELAPRGALTAFVAFVAIASLGYLGARVFRELPAWAAALLVVPVATIIVASRAQSRGAENHRRVSVLLDTAVRLPAATDAADVLETLRRSSGELLLDPRVGVREIPPGPTEIGARISGTDHPLWIVGPALNRARSSAHNDQQGLEALVALAEEAFERLRLSVAMQYLAWHDSLTELANRPLFMDRVGHALALQKRRGRRVAVLFCDLDGFKRVNDLFGHSAGDHLLVEVGRRIRDSVRDADTVARLGGDEFAVLIEDVVAPDEVGSACERILVALRNRIDVAGEDVSVTTTIGVAMSEPSSSAESLLSQADLAMYHAKGRGKNRWQVYDHTFGDERRQRIELVETLRGAVDRSELEVMYQSVIDLTTSRIVGVEALARWYNDGVAVPPGIFIPTAEESGLVVGIGNTVLDLVTNDAPALLEASGGALTVAVNVSPQQLQQDDFVGRVLSARDAMGGATLMLEVTERDERTAAAMSTLTEAGVNFAIDDFGVGFSSIGYLQRLPVRVLKIDGSFIQEIEDYPRECALVRSMVLMGETLGLDVVIEGIERPEQLLHVTEHAGAVFGQGYLFGRPMHRDEMIAQLLAERSTEPLRLVGA